MYISIYLSIYTIYIYIYILYIYEHVVMNGNTIEWAISVRHFDNLVVVNLSDSFDG